MSDAIRIQPADAIAETKIRTELSLEPPSAGSVCHGPRDAALDNFACTRPYVFAD